MGRGRDATRRLPGLTFAIVASCLLPLVAAPAAVRACEGFGCAGQIVPSGALGAQLTLVDQEPLPVLGIEGGVKLDHDLWLAPSLGYFVTDGLALGVELDLGWRSQASAVTTKETRIGGGLGVAAYAPFSATWGLWPQLWTTGSVRHREQEVVGGPLSYFDPAFGEQRLVRAHFESTARSLDLRLELPITWHFSGHAFLAVGPYGSLELASNEDAFDDRLIGLATRVGVWW